MSVSCTSGKRKQENLYQNQRKAQKLSEEPLSNFTPAFWNSLSHILLTRRALKEFNRRNRQSRSPTQYSPSPSPSHPSLTKEHLERVTQIASNGGLDLTKLRGYPEPRQKVMDRSTRRPATDNSASASRLTVTSTTKTKNSGPRDLNFKRKLIDGGVFPHRHVLPNGAGPVPMPENFTELTDRVLRPRPSLSLTGFTDADFDAFCLVVESDEKEEEVMDNEIPILEGATQEASCCASNKHFRNLKPMVDNIVCGSPDLYYGAKSSDIDDTVQKELKDLIKLSTQSDLPVAPNFFVEVKGSTGAQGVADLQALHTGAIGERGQIALRAWRQEGSGLDNKAHTITSTYCCGHLTIYAVHAGTSRVKKDRVDYYMTWLHTEYIASNAANFRRGVAAYRNMRDYAEEQRNMAIAMANSMVQRTGDAVE